MRSNRRKAAEETMAILEAGAYTVGGRAVRIGDGVAAAVAGARLYPPDGFAEPTGTARHTTVVELTRETTLDAARRLGKDVVALNFASAKNPGGGFLRGAHAQEEALARASGLYPTLRRFQEDFYDFHRAAGDLRYSDRMIYSPGVPVFRDETGALLDEPFPVSFITSAAPNRGALPPGTPVSEALRRRAWKVLALAAAEGHEHVVLGAWGCGVFRNDPAEVAEIWSDLLSGPFSGRFAHVAMAVWDPDGTTPQYRAFARVFRE
ncbi:TIGR02452 family protein [Actinocorallia sp. B10E7]|uniref:TIGR02452 family protein n=1 Tax=Actinocorallia sp. B10E7 TaxID=3153558 RepID=UPI00325D43FB